MDISPFTSCNSKIYVCGSDVTDIMKKLPCRVGIDEAGRGPVLDPMVYRQVRPAPLVLTCYCNDQRQYYLVWLPRLLGRGPMVYGLCYSPLEYADELKRMGFADSKTLNEEARDSMFKELNESPDKIGWLINILSPHYISNSMLQLVKYNLNALSHDTAIGLLRKTIDDGVNVKEVYVDTVGDPGKYQSKLEKEFPGIKITVAKKADSTYPICSAASICAKVSRDLALREWKFEEGTQFTDYGSGYPGDEKTKTFLQKSFDPVFGFSRIVRFGWSTAKKIMDNRGVAVKWIDEEEDEGKSRKPLKDFFKKDDKAAKCSLRKHKYFQQREMKLVNTL